jgi:hypothetical protein
VRSTSPLDYLSSECLLSVGRFLWVRVSHNFTAILLLPPSLRPPGFRQPRLALRGPADRASSIVSASPSLPAVRKAFWPPQRPPDGGQARLPPLGPDATLNRALGSSFNPSATTRGSMETLVELSERIRGLAAGSSIAITSYGLECMKARRIPRRQVELAIKRGQCTGEARRSDHAKLLHRILHGRGSRVSADDPADALLFPLTH